MKTGTSPSRSSISGFADPLTLADVVPRLLALDDEPARRCFVARCLALFPADDVLAALRTGAERYFSIDAHAQLRLAASLLDAAERACRSDQHPFGLMAKADALRALGRYQESVDHYDEAGRIFSTRGDEVGWARTRAGWLVSAHLLGRGIEALAAMGPAYDVLARHGEWSRAGGLDQNMAGICLWHGRYDEALRLYDRAQRTFEALGAAVENRAARARANKAEILLLFGDFQAARSLHEEARQVYARHGETAMVLRADQYTADTYAAQGDYTRALRLYGDVLAAFERSGQEVDAAWVALSTVECYLSLNRNAEALELGEETAARFERCGTPTEAAKARFACALAHTRLGNNDRALALLGEVAHVFATTGLTSYVGVAALQRAALHLDGEDWTAALAEAEAARDIFAERGMAVREAQADLARARALLGLGDLAGVRDLAGAALDAIRDREIHWLAHEGHHLLAAVARARGEVGAALAECRAAIAAIEQIQSRLALDLRGNFLADKLRVYHDAIDCCLRLPEPDSAAAFALLERAKSRALVDYLAANPEVRTRVRGAADRELADELGRLRAEHAWFYDRLYGPGLAQRPDAQGAGAPRADESETLRAQIRDREKRIARLLERLALRQTAGFEGYAPAPAGWDLVRPHLDQRTVLLEYYLHDRGGAVFVVTEQDLTVVSLPTGPGEIRRLLQRWQLNLDATARALGAGRSPAGLAGNASGLLQALYRALLAPVADALAGRDRLIVVPHGPLHQAPFAAFHDGERYLIESHEVVACPSSGLLRHCAERPRRPGKDALVIGYSDGGRLPFVAEEARAVAGLFPGACHLEGAATRAALVAGAARHAVIHLAAHGEARLDNPTFAHLKLADGQLGPADIFGLDLDGALVVLSACETGRAVVQGGDELIGLGRGFLHAGAATLVQSLWRVEDGSTARLMGYFYAALRAGATKGAALRGAQLALHGEPGAHPYLWAPFQLIGDDGPL